MTRSMRRGILIVLAGGLVLGLTFGVRQSFGVYLAPISTDLGWSVTVVSLALAIQAIVWGLGQPFFGWLADRHGTGRTIVIGTVIYALGLVWMSRASTPEEAYLSFGLLVGIGASGCGIPIIMTAVVRAFPRDRHPLVMSLTAAGVSLGQFAVTPMAPLAIEAIGWRGAMVAFTALLAVVALLAHPLRSRPVPPERREEVEQSLRDVLSEAWGHSGYLLLTVGFFVCGFHVQFVITHLPNFIAECGLPSSTGGWAISVIGIFNLIGTTAAGFLASRFRKKYLLSLLYALRAAMFAIYAFTPVTQTTTLIFAAGLGLAWLSTVPITSALVGQIFGTRYLGTLFGIVFLSHQVGSFLGAYLGGYFFALTGTYDMIWLVNIALGLLGALINLPIADRPIVRVRAEPA